MTKENRFEGLMDVVGKNKTAQTSKHSDVQKSDRKKKPSSSDISTSQHSNISTSNQPNIQTSVNKNKNQVDDSNLDISTSKHTDISTSKKAKSADPDYTRTTVYLPKKMHKKLKAIALDEEKEMSSIVEELIENWLSERGKDV